MVTDKYGKEIKVGDFIVCTGGQGTLQEMEVCKLRPSQRTSVWDEIYCLNDSGYKKWKVASETIVVTELKEQN